MTNGTKLTRADAIGVFTNTRIDRTAPFHALSSGDVLALLAYADSYGYRAPRNANGSRGRYWHAYLTRIINRKD